MRFLADESCDFAVVRALRAGGHDVVAVAELSRRAEDVAVINMAIKEERILLTEDKDFGQLVYADKRAMGGILLLRFPAKARSSLAKAVLDLVKRRGEKLIGRFIVIQPGRIRIGGTPGG
jgi:predicted nuclease of predicted toxin-antitoxin system